MSAQLYKHPPMGWVLKEGNEHVVLGCDHVVLDEEQRRMLIRAYRAGRVIKGTEIKNALSERVSWEK